MSKFITFEGCEGAGKSAQIRYLAEYLDQKGIKYITTREPGGTPEAEKIRSLILDPHAEMSGECEVMLYAAARADHLKNKIIPALESGINVICDRYIDSSYAYQAYARGLGFETVQKANFLAEARMPDVTVFLDLPPEQAFVRKGGADKDDRMEMEGLAFHRRVYEGYLALCDRFPQRIVRIECSGEREKTRSLVLAALIDRGII